MTALGDGPANSFAQQIVSSHLTDDLEQGIRLPEARLHEGFAQVDKRGLPGL